MHNSVVRVSPRRRTRLIAISAIIGVILFAVAYQGYDGTSGLGLYDQPVLLFMVSIRADLLSTIMGYATRLASPEFLVPLTLVVMVIWVIAKREWWRPLLLGGGMALSAVFAYGLKALTANPRPASSYMLPPLETSFSFPSGHVVGITALIFIFGYLLYSRHPERHSYVNWAVWGTLLVAFFAFTRLYLAAHWLTDVVAGFGIGLITLAIVAGVDWLVMGRHRGVHSARGMAAADGEQGERDP